MNISVIIPTFNRCHSLPRALDSVLNQTAPPHQIIVIDDGSTDHTQKLLEQQYSTVVCLTQQNRGVSAARNTGIRHATGDWIALLDSDDEWLPTKLQKQTVAAHQQPERLVHCDEIWIRNGVRVNAMNKHRKYGGHIFEQCLPLCAISPSAAMIRSDVFNDIGFFDEQLPACEDYDFWLRFCAQEPVCLVDEPLLKKYGGHQDQLSRHYPAMDRFRIASLLKLLNSGRLNHSQVTLTTAMVTKKLQIYTKGARKRGKEVEAIRLEEQVEQTLQHIRTRQD